MATITRVDDEMVLLKQPLNRGFDSIAWSWSNRAEEGWKAAFLRADQQP